MSKKLILAVMILIATSLIFAAPVNRDFSSLLDAARNGNLTENDLNELIGEIYTHQIDALRDVMNNPEAYSRYLANDTTERSNANYTDTRFSDTESNGQGNFGFVITNIGDINGAGAEGSYDAIAVGSPFYNNNTGRVYIYLGQAGTTVMLL